MVKALLDTDILSEIFKGVDQNVLRNASSYLDEYPSLTFTSISIYEVVFGLRVKGAARQLQQFLELTSEHEELVPSADNYRTAAAIRAAMHISGTPIGIADPIIAACAINNGLPLVTGSTRHCKFIQDVNFPLQLQNWREPQTG